MYRWIRTPYRYPKPTQRSIIFSIVLFMITTGLLYAVMERYPLTTNMISSTVIKRICQLKNETQRAIHLASSDFCKEKLQRIACDIDTQEQFFPRSLPRFCPIKNGHFGDVLGCLTNQNQSNNFQLFDTDILCIDYCLKLSNSFAAYNDLTHQCFCFSSTPESLISNMKCQDIKQNFSTIYRTSYLNFGNHLDKQRQIQDHTQTTIIFFLTVGGRKNFRQIKRLIRVIYSSQHYYLIHIDSRENYLFEQIRKFSLKFPNIHLTTQRYPTTWGSSTLLSAHLDAFREIFERLKWKFSFILNLSESDFPLKSIEILTNFLSMYTSKNFLRSHNREAFKFLKAQGLFHTFIHCENYMYRIGTRSLISNIIYDGGSDWYILNYDFVHYVIYGNDELVNGLRHIFNYSLLPCEAFFHTVLINSIYCDTYIRNNLRLVNWNRQRGCRCQHKNVVDWCGCSPIVYRNSDKQKLTEALEKPLFFARKFDPIIDETIIDWIEEKITGINFLNNSKNFYMQNLYHISDNTTNVNSLFALIDLYVRKMFLNCSTKIDFQLEQIHEVYHQSLFRGYTFQYQLFEQNKQIEYFIQLNSFESIRSKPLKRFEVGLELDSKEIVFIDRSRTFFQPKLFKVLIQWENITENNTILIIQNPIGTILQQIQLQSSFEPFIIDVVFPVNSLADMIGIWQMSIMNNQTKDLFGSINFLILLPNIDENIFSISKFWSVTNVCSMNNLSSICSEDFYQLKIEHCFRESWSSFFFDTKSHW